MFEVFWSEEILAWCDREIESDKYVLLSETNAVAMNEVIGNKYANPELLDVK